jgi:hypothetical protein
VQKVLIISALIGGICGNISAPVTAQTAVAKPVVASIPNAVKLLSNGAEPRRELKFSPVVNSKQKMVMVMGIAMDMTMGDSTMPKIDLPKISMELNLTVEKIDPSGDIHYNFVYGEMRALPGKDIPPEMIAAMQKSLKSLTGLKGNIIIDSKGRVKSKNLTPPKNIDPTIKQTIDQMNKTLDQISTYLPTEMVGVGARWQTTNSLEASGIRLNQISTNEVMAIDDRGMTVKTLITQSSPPQDIQLPGVGKKAKVRLNSLTSNGEGKYIVRFGSLLPLEGKLLINTNSNMSFQAPGETQATNMVSKMAIDLSIAGN